MGNQKNRSSRGGWRPWSEKQARARLDALAESGLSVAAFARRRGVSARRLPYWAQRLDQPARVAFVPVSFPAVVAPPDAVIEIAAGDVVLRVREGLHVEHLARLVAALAGSRSC